ncbi:lipase [Adhaeribacter aerolatus]|uniref:Lipase n=1 Tax=Adhaeribacter aerolatus TaxID=670289 RepID=A0A512AXS1_9BACT|nr:SGNH/GDSL hydrolase family protein [Adhaeribacter aerolatus]GEO04513.1 lipase [Adhaeribacter aerolatus]
MKTENNTGRRDFLKKATIGGLATWAIPEIVEAGLAAGKGRQITLAKNDIVLFQGDSITDAGRKRENKNQNSAPALGSGYAYLAAAEMLQKFPGKTLQIYNRGVSADKVYQLADRWQTDTLDLKPNVLSILIGVNDHWHIIKKGYAGSLKKYQDDYRALLDRTKQNLPDVKFIIGEPFGVTGIKGNYENWDPAFKDYQLAARKIAENFSAAFIPYQSVFDQARKVAPSTYWTYDGVHTTIAGAKLMAEAWLQTVKA